MVVSIIYFMVFFYPFTLNYTNLFNINISIYIIAFPVL